MSSPEPWVVAVPRWLLRCALAGATGGNRLATARTHTSPAVTAVLSVLTWPGRPIRPIGYQHRTSQR